MDLRSINEIVHFHVHVFFDADSRAQALQLRTDIGARFKVQVGRVFEVPVGPHPLPQYEIGVFADELTPLLSWLMLNRGSLTILLHPNTDQEIADHFDSACWLGTPLTLSPKPLQVSLRAAGQDGPRPVLINSQPHLPY